MLGTLTLTEGVNSFGFLPTFEDPMRSYGFLCCTVVGVVFVGVEFTLVDFASAFVDDELTGVTVRP